MNKPAPEEKPERLPFLSPMDKKILGYYAFTTAMVVCMIGAIIAASFSLFYTSEDVPAGGTTLLWRIPMFLCWAGFGIFAWYKTAEFWDPADVQWVKDLAKKLRRR
jgi:hypothetical protein